ncbi:trehalose-phosphatase [Mycobacterium shinjukuense]|uniref:Putative glycosyl hydrolase n=1 Tax=Mycobacterium shinjukuense TaxID=398694 RepID=A0A7I7MML9_9MYCO|nr:trehalose-phosphatase [Mycobacterium shinjukuense]ORB70962.1 trehalose-phosphatase [Mycobacterium shinjukuense]BBX73072.1 putative glycosyl hydrolase [Mycobacterium shinjukuense]
MTDWPAAIDRRHHDAVIFGLDVLVTDTASGGVRVFDSTVPVLRRLRDAGVATAVCSPTGNTAAVLRAAGVDEFIGLAVGEVGTEPAVLIDTATRLGVRPGRCVLIAHDQAAVRAASDGGFGLVIALDGHPDELLPQGADAVIADLAEISVRSGDAALSTIPDALGVYSQLKELVTARRPAVFLDFDGTLSDIVEHPGSAVLVDGAADAVRALAAQCPVAVISGRDLADVRARVDVDGLWFAGSHGFELVAPDGSHHQNAAAAAAIDALALAANRLAAELTDFPGTVVEHKRFAVAVHYRGVDPDHVDAVIAATRRLGRSAGLRATTGRQVIELRPNIAWDKGRTLHWMIDHMSRSAGAAETVLPIYIGDDITDEDAFDAVRFDGVGIVVRHDENRDRPSAASFSLENPSAVRDFIQRLAADLGNAAASPSDPWQLVYQGYDPGDERLREALCTVGNGYVATRGCAPESSACQAHYPGTYVTGVYNTLADRVAGRTVENESLVNLPNWLSLTFRIDGGPWFDVDDAELLCYRQTFDLRQATLTRSLRFRDRAGRITAVDQQRFAAMHEPHVLAMKTTIRAENWSGTVEFRSLLDAAVRNTMVDRYRSLSSTHLTASVIDEISPGSVLLRTETSQSRIAIAVAARSTVWRDDAPADAHYAIVREPGRGGHDIRVALAAGRSVTCEKVATIFTGRDTAISEPASTAQQCLHGAGRYADLHRQHARAWARLWEQCNIGLADGTGALGVLRLHLVHLLQTVSPHTADLDAGVPARGLHGEAYRGHVFWDELFVCPVLNLRLPNVSRSLLRYRYRRLPEARRAARRAGYLGAMYPWQSGSDGREVSQQLHLNPRSGRWNPDPSARAHHVGLAVAYNTWQHYQVTGDRQFLVDYGAEMLVEIARFWVGLANFDDGRGRYTIRGILGPDEFHSGYPGKEYDGIDNNAYTNVMAVWAILRAMDALALLPLRDRLELVGKLGLTTQERDRWDHVSRRMFVPFHDNVISQFEGYSELAELDWCHYRQRYGNIQRLDRILEAENDSVNNYKASKQADALMLFYLLSSEELLGLFGRLGYHFAPEQIPKTIDYYLARTSHGSTLSGVVHSWVLARANRNNAMEYFQQVLDSDVADIQGGTTAEGIHLAAMAGSVDLLQRCFTGLETRDDRLVLGPQWPATLGPESLGPIEFPFVYRGHRLHLRISGRTATLTAESGSTGPIDVECRGRVHRLLPGHTIEVG